MVNIMMVQVKLNYSEHNNGTSQIKFDEHYQNWVRKTTHELRHNKCITDVVMKRLSEKAREISKLYDIIQRLLQWDMYIKNFSMPSPTSKNYIIQRKTLMMD